jgi:hypothetical protein
MPVFYLPEQVDSRLLRAVAIEHPKDADMAAEVVLTEIMPSLAKKLLPVTPTQEMSPRVIVNLEGVSTYYIHAFHTTLFLACIKLVYLY